MLKMKTENWNGYNIRFIIVDGEWWAIATDVAKALGYKFTTNMTRLLEAKDKGVHKVNTLGGVQTLVTMNEYAIYDATFNSHKPEAKEFKRWVYDKKIYIEREKAITRPFLYSCC